MASDLAFSDDPSPKPERAPLSGTWECALPYELLTWSYGVYDVFELPRGMPITRSEVLGFYTDESRQELEKIRAGAMEEQTSFSLDLEITTALGKRRWVRLAAHIEYCNGVPHRLYGTHEDITAAKLNSDTAS